MKLNEQQFNEAIQYLEESAKEMIFEPIKKENTYVQVFPVGRDLTD